MNKTWLTGIIVAVLAGAVWIVGDAFKQLVKSKTPPPAGWQTIRPPQEVYALVIAGNEVWAGGKDGLYKINRFSGQVEEKLVSASGITYVRGLELDKQGRLWIGYQQGLVIYDGKSFTPVEGLPDKRVNCVYRDRQDRMWVGTWGGAVCFDGNVRKVFTKADGLLDDMVNVIFQDADKNLWFGSYTAPAGGLNFFDGSQWQRWSVKQGLPHNNINAIIQAADGLIWVGGGLLERGGAARFVKTDDGWRLQGVWAKKDGLAGEKVRSLYQDSRGALWMNSEFDGAVIWENGCFRKLSTANGLCDQEIKSIRQDVEGNIWLGTRNGLMKINKNNLP